MSIAKTRYYYSTTIAHKWHSGWCFGFTPEEAAADAINDAQRTFACVGKSLTVPSVVRVVLKSDSAPGAIVEVAQ